jgi:hypothetical protein
LPTRPDSKMSRTNIVCWETIQSCINHFGFWVFV